MKNLTLFLALLLLSSPAFADYPPAIPGGYVLLREYFEKIFDEQKRYIDKVIAEQEKFNNARFEASEQALEVSKVELDRRFVLLTEYAKKNIRV